MRIRKYPATNKKKFIMSDIQLKMIRHTKRQESMTHNEEEKNQSIETDPKLTQMSELADKNRSSSYYNCILGFKKSSRDIKDIFK